MSRPVICNLETRGLNMHPGFWRSLTFVCFSISLISHAQSSPQSGGDFSNNPQPNALPSEVLLVKGAWSSASDLVTPVPEGGRVANNVFSNQYFGFTYTLSPDWTQKYVGPPPSDSGYYVLAQIRPAETSCPFGCFCRPASLG